MIFSNSFLYYKGSSRKNEVALRFSEDTLFVSVGEVIHEYDLSDVTISTPMPDSPLVMTVKTGERIEVYDKDSIIEYLEHKNLLKSYSPYFIEKRKYLFLAALIVFFVISFFMVKVGIPTTSRILATYVPAPVAVKIDDLTVNQFDKILFTESEIDKKTKDELVNMFSELGLDRYKIMFRKGNQLRANAIALAHHTIIITDELIEHLEKKEYILAVLIHEIGHIEKRHVMTQLIQDSFISFLAMFYFGDLNNGVEHMINLGAIFYSRSFSRGFESEADEFALEKLQALGLSIKCFTQSMTKLHEYYDAGKSDEEDSILEYLSTHPSFKERTQDIDKRFPDARDC